MGVLVPRDRRGEFHSQVLPRYRRYEQEISQDLSLMFLCGILTRTLSAISLRLLGRRISPAEVSEANQELVEAVEKWRRRVVLPELYKYAQYVDKLSTYCAYLCYIKLTNCFSEDTNRP